MRQGDGFGFFQSQLAEVSNCGEDVSALSFISRL